MTRLTRFSIAFILIILCWLSVSIVAAQETESCDSAVDYATLATTLMQKQDSERSIDAFTCAIENDSKNYFLYLGRGWAYLMQFRYEEAIADLEISDDLMSYSQTQFYLGKAYAGLLDYEEAIRYFDKSIDQNSSFIESYIERGVAYAMLNDFDASIEDFNQALEMDESNVYALGSRGWAYARSGDYEAAVGDFNRVLEINPLFKDSAMTLGDSQRVTISAYIDAVADLEAANETIEQGEDNSKTYRRRGIAYLNLGQLDDALTDLTQAIELDDEDVEAYFTRGTLRGYYRDDFTGALADFERIMEIDPDYANAYMLHGAIQSQLENYAEAIDDYTRYLELEPDQVGFYLNRGIMYSLNGDDAEAAQDYVTYASRDSIRPVDLGSLTVGEPTLLTMSNNKVFELTFDVQAGENLKLSAAATNVSLSIDTLIIVLAPDGTPLTANDDNIAEVDATAVIRDFEVPEDGTYTLIVTHAGGWREGEVAVLIQSDS
jgi:tetratricopeptide (TPR) repeat protein